MNITYKITYRNIHFFVDNVVIRINHEYKEVEMIKIIQTINKNDYKILYPNTFSQVKRMVKSLGYSSYKADKIAEYVKYTCKTERINLDNFFILYNL